MHQFFFPTSVSHCFYNTVNVTGTDTRCVFFPPVFVQDNTFFFIFSPFGFNFQTTETEPCQYAYSSDTGRNNRVRREENPTMHWTLLPYLHERRIHQSSCTASVSTLQVWDVERKKIQIPYAVINSGPSKWYFHRGGVERGGFWGPHIGPQLYCNLAQNWDSGSK